MKIFRRIEITLKRMHTDSEFARRSIPTVSIHTLPSINAGLSWRNPIDVSKIDHRKRNRQNIQGTQKIIELPIRTNSNEWPIQTLSFTRFYISLRAKLTKISFPHIGNTDGKDGISKKKRRKSPLLRNRRAPPANHNTTD